MRLGFVGGNGHHLLRALALEQPDRFEAAFCGDGCDDDAARRAWEAFRASPPASPRPRPPRWFDRLSAMLDEFQPEAVNVGAVYGHNGRVIAAVLERDVAVVSDKPIAATWEQLARLEALVAARPRAVLLTEFDFRARPEFVAARAAVREGRIGTVTLVTAQKSYRFGARPAWYARREDYGGTLLWVASHAIDAVTFVTGLTPTRTLGVQGNLTRSEYGTMEDHVAVLLTLSGGGAAMVHADYLRPATATTHGDDRLRVAGSAGVVEVRDGRCLLTTHDQAEHDITAAGACEPVHRQLLRALGGDRDVPYGTAESLRAARILLAARDAADRREWVAIA